MRPLRKTSTSSSSRRVAAALALAVLFAGRPGAAAEEERASEALHRLGYLAADYPRAAAGGIVLSPAEHLEHVALAAEVVADARAVAAASGDDELVAAAEAFEGRVEASAPEAEWRRNP